MTHQQLTEIIRIVNKKAIANQLKAIGYIDCKKHKELRYLSIEILFKGELEETDTFPNSNGKRTYQGGIFTHVKGYEQYEFVIVNISDHNHTFPIDMLVWAKDIER